MSFQPSCYHTLCLRTLNTQYTSINIIWLHLWKVISYYSLLLTICFYLLLFLQSISTKLISVFVYRFQCTISCRLSKIRGVEDLHLKMATKCRGTWPDRHRCRHRFHHVWADRCLWPDHKFLGWAARCCSSGTTLGARCITSRTSCRRFSGNSSCSHNNTSHRPPLNRCRLWRQHDVTPGSKRLLRGPPYFEKRRTKNNSHLYSVVGIFRRWKQYNYKFIIYTNSVLFLRRVFKITKLHIDKYVQDNDFLIEYKIGTQYNWYCTYLLGIYQ